MQVNCKDDSKPDIKSPTQKQSLLPQRRLEPQKISSSYLRKNSKIHTAQTNFENLDKTKTELAIQNIRFKESQQ